MKFDLMILKVFFIFLLQFFFKFTVTWIFYTTLQVTCMGDFIFLVGLYFGPKNGTWFFVKIMFLEFTQKFDLICMIKLPNRSIYWYIKVMLCNGHDVIDQVTSTIDLDRKNEYNSLNIGPRTPKSMYILIYQGQAF